MSNGSEPPVKFRTLVGVASGLTALTVAIPGASALAVSNQPARVMSVPATPDNFLEQELTWSPCYNEKELPEDLPATLLAAAKRMQCTKVTAPRDWYNPKDGETIKVALSRLGPAEGTPTESLLLNPGGPGGPGLSMPLLFHDRPHVLKSMEAVGFDPRGTGMSTNISCDGAPNDSSDPRDRDPRNLSLIADTSEMIGRYCAFKSGDLLPYINTEQTVRDLDLVRHLLGREKLNWLGYSGGTWMGAYYATFFPKRVGKFVLDSNTEFTAPWQQSFSRQAQGFERRFREDFAGWVAQYNDRFKLGTSPEKVRQNYEKVREEIARNPLNGFFFMINGTFLDNIIAQMMYDKGSFQMLAEFLSEVRAFIDNPARTPAHVSRLTASLSRVSASHRFGISRGMQSMSGSADMATFYAITCNDTLWDRDPKYWERESMEQGLKYPLIGWSVVSAQCAHWDRPSMQQLPTPKGKGVPPVLMVQSKNDPATPYEGAVAAHKRFAGSRMITIENEGNHGIYAGDNECANGAVDAFLTQGKLPDGDLTCKGVGIAPPKDPPAETEAAASGTVSNPLMRVIGFNNLLLGRMKF